MHIHPSARDRKFLLRLMLGLMVLSLLAAASGSSAARAREMVPPPGVTYEVSGPRIPGAPDYYLASSIKFPDGAVIQKKIINGPPEPPPGFEAQRQPVTLPKSNGTTTNAIIGPGSGDAYVIGCAATSGVYMAGYYDRSGYPSLISGAADAQSQSWYPNIYTGPTNGGVMPPDNSLWPTWTDGAGHTYANNPLTASHMGVDGRTTRGTIDDYWVSYGSTAPDPYITGKWTQHAWGDAIGDYMLTSQSVFGNTDGSTSFYTYQNHPDPLTCDEMADRSLPDGTLGMKRFYEARGYGVSACYNQPTDNYMSGGFTFAQLKAEIDAGRPVMLGLDGHTVVAIGYDTSTSTVYIHDGWDFAVHAMTWGRSYAGMGLQNVSIINLAPPPSYTISGNAGVAGVTLSYTVGTPKTATSDAGGNYSIQVPVGWSGTVTPSKTGYNFSPASRTYTNLAASQTSQNYTASLITYTISGNAGTAGTTLTYTNNGAPSFALADGSGNYSIILPMGWSGAITPHKMGYSFTPGSKSYSNLQSNQAGQDYTASVCPACVEKDTVGVFRPSNGLLYLKNLNITGYADVAINYGLGGDYPVVGDWDGNGTDTIGVYRSGIFLLRNSNTVGFANLNFAFGQPGDQPIAGDWDGDGDDTIGVYRPSTGQFLLRNSNEMGDADISFYLGNAGDVGIAGDWNGDGTDTVGVFRPSNGVIFLKNTNVTGYADVALNYGLAGDKPVVGDWDNNGTTTIGIYRGGRFYLRNSNTNGFAEIILALGIPGDMPIAGNWDAKP